MTVFYKFISINVSREFDKIWVDTHLCKLRNTGRPFLVRFMSKDLINNSSSISIIMDIKPAMNHDENISMFGDMEIIVYFEVLE